VVGDYAVGAPGEVEGKQLREYLAGGLYQPAYILGMQPLPLVIRLGVFKGDGGEAGLPILILKAAGAQLVVFIPPLLGAQGQRSRAVEPAAVYLREKIANRYKEAYNR